jgi:N4-(beta-N-acetylglucosaminyl)-L-asparaginase
MVVIDGAGGMAAGASTNGAIHKIPGRVGDGAVPGGGAYADGEAGGCGATGDGDTHLRFLPCFHAVEELRRGAAPREAAEAAVRRVARRVEGYVGAVVVVDRDGNHGAACHGWTFRYAVRGGGRGGAAAEVVEVPCSSLKSL